MTLINKIPVFTQEICYFTLPNFEHFKEQIMQIILVESNDVHQIKTSPDKECNIKAQRTAWNSHDRYPVVNNICKIVQDYLLEYIADEGYDIPELELINSWINWYGKGESALPHDHGHQLSCVLFVDVEKSNAKFLAHSDRSTVFIKKTDQQTNFSNIKSINATDGTVLFFDGRMMHSVSPNLTNNLRITLAMNYQPIYKNKR